MQVNEDRTYLLSVLAPNSKFSISQIPLR